MSRSGKSSAGRKPSAFAVVEIISIVILALVMVSMLVFNFFFKENGVASFFGLSFYNTRAVNMQPKIPQNTLVIAKKSEIPNIVRKSVILCNVGDHVALIGVEDIVQENGETYYIVKFETAPANETFRISQNDVIAKGVWQINGFGTFLDFATSAVGIIIAILIPLIFVIAFQVARILGIKKLEEEAASIDDIDEFISSREEESPAPVTFTEPKFIEDVTGKLPAVGGMGVREPEQPKIEKILSVDGKGRAEYAERPAARENSESTPLFTYERIRGKEPAMSGAAKASKDELYMNKPTRIEGKSATEEFFEKYAPKQTEKVPENMFSTAKSEPVVFTPHLSNVIPDSIAAVQEKMESTAKNTAGNGAKTYFEKEKVFAPMAETLKENLADAPRTIPENAVLPKETIAPPKKQKSSKALAELMSIIDAEETKLKK